MKTKGYAVAIRLFSNMALVMRRSSKEQSSYKKVPGEQPKLTPMQLQDIKKANARRAKERRQEQKIAEKVQIENDTSAMLRIAQRNNAGIKHLSYFINLLDYADEQMLPASVFEMTKRMTEEEAVKEWGTIRRALGKGKAPQLRAVTIGRRPKGWWTLRVVLIGDTQNDDCYLLSMPLYTYLYRNRKWKGEGAASSAKAGKLKEHYLLHHEDAGETFRRYIPEIYEVYRAGLTMPGTSRTYRTTTAEEVLKQPRRSLSVNNQAATVVNGTNIKISSPSGVALCFIETKKGIVIDAEWICAPEDPMDYLEDAEELPDDSNEF